jgi:hypothetical protein
VVLECISKAGARPSAVVCYEEKRDSVVQQCCRQRRCRRKDVPEGGGEAVEYPAEAPTHDVPVVEHCVKIAAEPPAVQHLAVLLTLIHGNTNEGYEFYQGNHNLHTQNTHTHKPHTQKPKKITCKKIFHDSARKIFHDFARKIFGDFFLKRASRIRGIERFYPCVKKRRPLFFHTQLFPCSKFFFGTTMGSGHLAELSTPVPHFCFFSTFHKPLFLQGGGYML